MSITTYDELVTAVTNWTHKRQDIAPLIPDFIVLAEIDMYNNSDNPLRVRQLEITSTAAASTDRLALPNGFESMRLIRISDSIRTALDYKAPEALERISGTGRPTQYTIIGDEIEFNRVPDSNYTIEMQYLRRAPALTNTNQTNDILTNYPNIYLSGTMLQYAIWSEETDQIQIWGAKFEDAIRGANRAWKKGKYGTAPTVQLRAMTP